uniref:Uncharacterized protein n=1 Tax=Anguilla anguilla TaxID=7936 RepID=A0A0E9S6Y5_ANGAN
MGDSQASFSDDIIALELFTVLFLLPADVAGLLLAFRGLIWNTVIRRS